MSGKSRRAQEQEDITRQQREQTERQAGERERQAALESQKRLTEAGQAKPEETERLSRYKEKALTPGETLLTQQGPIAQALAKRIQERVETPGLDYQRDLPAYEAGVTEPLWRALKQRGIAPPPGSEGGGLGTQQYMKGAEPALAFLRSGAITQDISRGQEYGREARGAQGRYEDLESMLAEAIRGRQFGAETGAAPYSLTAEERRSRGERTAAGIAQEYKSGEARRREAEQKERADRIERVMSAVIGNYSQAGKTGAGIQGGQGGQMTGYQQAGGLPGGQTWSPYDQYGNRLLAARQAGRA